MLTCSITSKIQVPPKTLLIEFEFIQSGFQVIKTFFPLTSTNKLTNLANKHSKLKGLFKWMRPTSSAKKEMGQTLKLHFWVQHLFILFLIIEHLLFLFNLQVICYWFQSVSVSYYLFMKQKVLAGQSSPLLALKISHFWPGAKPVHLPTKLA